MAGPSATAAGSSSRSGVTTSGTRAVSAAARRSDHGHELVPAQRQVARDGERRLADLRGRRPCAARPSGRPARGRPGRRPPARRAAAPARRAGRAPGPSAGRPERTTTHGGRVRRHGASRDLGQRRPDRLLGVRRRRRARRAPPRPTRAATTTCCPRQSQKSVATPCAVASSTSSGEGTAADGSGPAAGRCSVIEGRVCRTGDWTGSRCVGTASRRPDGCVRRRRRRRCSRRRRPRGRAPSSGRTGRCRGSARRCRSAPAAGAAASRGRRPCGRP